MEQYIINALNIFSFIMCMIAVSMFLCICFKNNIDRLITLYFLGAKKYGDFYDEFFKRATEVCKQASLRGRNGNYVEWYIRIPSRHKAIEDMMIHKDWYNVLPHLLSHEILDDMRK